MTNVIDWILDLFRDPVRAQEFIANPDRSWRQPACRTSPPPRCRPLRPPWHPPRSSTAAANPVHGLQQAVAETHGIAFAPQYAPVWAPETEAFSNNDTLSHNDCAEPQRRPRCRSRAA